MPTIFEQDGYRLMVFISGEHPPPHVHVIHDGTSIPVLIDPEKATWRGDSDGRKPQRSEIRKVVRSSRNESNNASPPGTCIMPARAIIPTNAEIDAALANPPPKDGPRASAVAYSTARDEIGLTLDSGVTLVIPRSAIAEFRNVPKSHMHRLDLTPGGAAVALDEHDIHIFVPGLVLDLTDRKEQRPGAQRNHPNTAAFKAKKPRAAVKASRA